MTPATPPSRSRLFGPLGRRTELVRAYAELDDVCSQLGFGTDLTLGEWSTSPQRALLTLARAARPPPPPPARDWSMATIPEVVADIVGTHHLPLRHELERLDILIDHLVVAYPRSGLVALHREYHQFKNEIILHIDHEEAELFPLCIELEDALCGRISWSSRESTSIIRFASHGHSENEAMLQRIIYQAKVVEGGLSDEDVMIVRVGLQSLAGDLVIHSAKEGEILFPAAIFSEELLRARHVKPSDDSAGE